MRFLANPTVPGVLDAVAAYMIHWASLPPETKYEVLHEWMKVADFIESTFPIPRVEVKGTDFRRVDLREQPVQLSIQSAGMVYVHYSWLVGKC